MKKIIPLLAFCVFVQGCVGAGVLRKQTDVVQDPNVPEEACVALYDIDRSNPTNTVVFTAEWLEAHWGKPAVVAHADAGDLDTIWTYKFGPIWEGVEPVVVIPIPIALPLERKKVRFVLRNGRVISATLTTPQTVGGAIGLTVGPCGAHFGPFSLDD